MEFHNKIFDKLKELSKKSSNLIQKLYLNANIHEKIAVYLRLVLSRLKDNERKRTIRFFELRH